MVNRVAESPTSPSSIGDCSQNLHHWTSLHNWQIDTILNSLPHCTPAIADTLYKLIYQGILSLISLTSFLSLLSLVSFLRLLGLVSFLRVLGLISFLRPLGLVSFLRLLGLVSFLRPLGLVSFLRLLGLVSFLRPLGPVSLHLVPPWRIVSIHRK